jgi:glucose/arabinose dehydrogenase
VSRSLLCLVMIVAAAGCSSGTAGTSASRSTTAGGRVALVTVASGLDSPVDLVAAPGSRDLAVVEKTGRVLLLRDGRIQPRPLLDLRGRVSQGSEQGLLSIAFDPGYARNRLAYVDYTDLAGDTHIARLDTAAGRLRTILVVHQPFTNHNGGGLAFGPDGRLYVGMGDGGSEGDPQGNGQNLASPLGKILRLDVRRPRPRPQMYAYGLRNPWRISFDRTSGDLWIGDVGQDRFEEVDRLAAGTPPGANLGWNVYEARSVYKHRRIDRSRLVWPVTYYAHALGCSITGGYVYRGSALPALRGRYVYGDFCSGRIWSIGVQGGRPRLLDLPALHGLDSFGQDASGELYAVTLGGRVLRFVTAR